MADLRTFREWFDPYNKQHIEWAREYFDTTNVFSWEDVVPDDVVISNDYGIREHIRNCFSSCWILYKLEGMERAPITH